MSARPTRKLFDQAAARVTRRLALVAGLRVLGKSAAIVFGAALVAWVALRLSGARDAMWWAPALIAAWLAGTALFVWLRRPKPFAALAAWDRAAAARETLASAWSFEQGGSAGPGAALHLARASEQLAARGPALARDLPLRLPPVAWIAPLVFVTFVFSGWLQAPVAQEDQGLSDAARARASATGRELAERARVVDPLKSLTEEEKKKLEALRQELERSAKGLDRLNTPREILEELERKAREAEKLAEALRTDDAGALSGSFLAELERNADTADLGNSLRAGDLNSAAEQARIIWARLGSRKPPTLEEQKRLEEALKRALEAANQKDRTSPTGRRLDEARQQLSAGNPGGAAQQFDQLAQDLARAGQRQQAQQQLRNLAQTFRGAGSQIFGGQNLQRLTPQAPSGSQPLAGMPQLVPGTRTPGSPQGMLPMPSPGSGTASGQLPLPTPGTGTSRGGMPYPIPGSGQAHAGNSVPLPIPGTGQNPGGTAFPVPGMGGLPGTGAPLAAVPGTGAASANGGGVGGSEAGRGTADLGSDPTKPLDAKLTGTVAPAPGAEGPSQTRAVEGESHREAPARTRQEIAAEFLNAEEAALAEEQLPASRREQILRYFTAIRQQLERQP